MKETSKMLVGGHWLPAEESFEVTNKYNGELLGRVPTCDKEIFEMAVRAAQDGLEILSNAPSHQRAQILSKTSRLIEANNADLAELIAQEAGKPVKQALKEVERAIQTFQFASQEAKNIHGETIPMDAAAGSEKKEGFYLRFPVGMVGAISPFNFPLNLVAHKVAPAIAAGCSVILKPSSLTPLTAIKLGEIMQEAGLPAGVLNIVFGSGSSVGSWIVTDPRIALVSFTGSPLIGKTIKESSGLKKIILELGSNSAVVVDVSADLNSAIPLCVQGGFNFAGQSCISVQRIYVHKQIFDKFVDSFMTEVKKLKVGNPSNYETDVGPLITETEAKRIESWIKEAVSQGAKILVGGKRQSQFLHPTILTNVKSDMKVVANEVFAPLVSIIPFAEFEEALNLVNDSAYGLQAGIFTKDIQKAFAAVKKLKVGGVMINEVPTYRADHMPYGGVKDSGIGREGVKYAVEEMTDIKMVCFNLV